MDAVQKVIDYVNILDIVSQSKGTEEDATKLANEIDTKWWAVNKHRFLP